MRPFGSNASKPLSPYWCSTRPDTFYTTQPLTRSPSAKSILGTNPYNLKVQNQDQTELFELHQYLLACAAQEQTGRGKNCAKIYKYAYNEASKQKQTAIQYQNDDNYMFYELGRQCYLALTLAQQKTLLTIIKEITK